MKIGILIGRFQVPEPHEGHRFLFHRILEECDELFILVGSSNRARSVRNPYTFKERSSAISKVLTYEQDRVTILPLNDYTYSDSQWMSDVAATIGKYVTEGDTVVLYGHFKEGNDYLKWFPQFNYVNIESEIEISGTEIRNSFSHLLPKSVQDDIKCFEQDKKLFASYPYPDCLQSNCGDSVVTCLGHVLLIERKHAPGAGTWALPGGHKLSQETFLECALRELEEETNLRVPRKVLIGSIVSTKLFDNPKRSNGIVKCTLAVHMDIKPDQDGKLPRANARDDALNVKWVPIEEALNKYSLYDDHGDIISTMTGVMPLIAVDNISIYNR